MITTTTDDPLMARAKALKLYGLLTHWAEVAGTPWIELPIRWEEEERARRSLERRLGSARLGRFGSLANFDWDWPKRCDRGAVEALMGLAFLQETANAILIGPNGVGKSTIARNIAYQAVLAGYTVLCTSASQMLGELAAADGDNALRRRLALYSRPRLLLLDLC
jgi:DNA replication protein DnaC